MLFVCLLAISLILLFAFSMSKEKGKNTKFARKGANAIAQENVSSQSIDTTNVIEIN
ncbi:hypothetical protein [uncultured Paraglaciecola sp.]|uniref:hypothetical protein n=1 Tax=uncultured Paraglaciecola sp. TaxID=1765024 RepID=UPI0026249835|nr:hypothetical protein [uncultured Paraglaciecola sp.]